MSQSESKTLTVPRGLSNLPPLVLDMSVVYQTEGRLHEVSFATPATSPELMGFFNYSCNIVMKYLSWIEYEILSAEKSFELAKASVILDKMPEAAMKYKDTGMKNNEDFRSALIATDIECSSALERLNFLKASRTLLEGKAKSFIRAYNSCKVIWERRDHIAAQPNLSGTGFERNMVREDIGQCVQPEDESDYSFIGKTKF